jgi:CBS domain-containing protein
MNVEDVMTRDVVTVQPSTPLKDLAEILVQRGISGVPVVAVTGEVVGIVSEGDILLKERGPSQHKGPHHWLLRSRDSEDDAKIKARTAGEMMSAPPVTTEADKPLSKAARLMLEHGVNRLPVTKDGKLVGIITRADMVRAFSRSDEDIEREIREDVLAHLMWLRNPDAVVVHVDQGEVTLSGEVDTRSDAELVRTLTSRVPGVVDVDSSLTFLPG